MRKDESATEGKRTYNLLDNPFEVRELDSCEALDDPPPEELPANENNCQPPERQATEEV